MVPEKIDEEARLKFKAAIIELENVIAETAPYEAEAWRKVAAERGVFADDWEKRLKEYGEDRIIHWIMEKSVQPETEKRDMVAKKELYYNAMMMQLSPKDLLPGIAPLLKDLKKNGVRIAAASARKHTSATLEQLEIGDFFDEVIDEADISNARPIIEKVFAAAKDLDTLYKKCVAIVNTRLKLIREGETELFVVGVGSKDPVEGTDWTVENTGELTYEGLKERFLKKR